MASVTEIDASAQQTIEQSIPSYTVDGLLEKIGVSANIQVWKSIDSIINVQGLVRKIKPYGRVVYFELVGGSTKLNIKCPIELQPKEGDNIIVEGMATLKPSKFHAGLELTIDGKPVGKIEPPEPDTNTPLIKLQKDSFLRLHDYLADQGLDEFCLLGTNTAIRDALSKVNSDIKKLITTKTIRVADKDAMLSDLREAIYDCNAFAIVRGGDDASLSIWNDPEVINALLDFDCPFYIALGHSHFISLTAQYADESFHAPIDLGIAINTIVHRLLNEHRQINELEKLKKHQAKIDKEYAVTKEREQAQSEKIEKLSSNIDWFKQTNAKYKKQNNLLLVATALLGAIVMLTIMI